MSLNANDGSGLLFQFFYLSFDNNRHFPRRWNEESVHIKHSDFISVTGSKLQTINDYKCHSEVSWCHSVIVS